MGGHIVHKKLIDNSFILKNKKELRTEEAKLKHILLTANKLSFWRSHFKNNHVGLSKRKFTWNDWINIPYITKPDFLALTLGKRIKDAAVIFKRNPMRFILQATSGTSKSTGPILFLKNVDELVEGDAHDAGKRVLILYQSRAISLRDVIVGIRANTKQRQFQSLVVNPFGFDNKMIKAVEEFGADSIITFPSCVTYLTSFFPKSLDIFSKVRHLWTSGDFLSNQQLDFIKSKLNFKNLNVDIDYIMTEVDSIGMCCNYLRKKNGLNAYHPNPERIVEISNTDGDGRGEVVVSKLHPQELAIIRYKTGDLARVVHTTCRCGNEWTIILDGRKNMDYIKHLGILITRAEIERVLKTIGEVEDWRGEVSEAKLNKTLVGKLKLFLLFKKGASPTLAKIKTDISKNLLLTPHKTLSTLTKEGKFMPLEIKIVKEFPQMAKKVPLRKVIN